MTTVALIIALLGQPKLSPVGCNQVVDGLVDLEVAQLKQEEFEKPSKDLSLIKAWSRGCKYGWRKR